jgi:hypothetical protein
MAKATMEHSCDPLTGTPYDAERHTAEEFGRMQATCEEGPQKPRLIGVLGMCPKCGGTRPTCCTCPEHDQPTHYYQEGEMIPAGADVLVATVVSSREE